VEDAMNLKWCVYDYLFTGRQRVDHVLYRVTPSPIYGEQHHRLATVYECSRRYHSDGMPSFGRAWPKEIKDLNEMKKYVETLARMEGL
jgi:hypothetical protein